MPFEQYADFDPANLPIETRYRFAELEINQGLKVMQQVYKTFIDSYQLSNNFIYELLFYYSERTTQSHSDWNEAIRTHLFKSPTKHELINYFLYNQQSYANIRALMGASPNTIAKQRFQPAPFYLPVFKHWNTTMLDRWDHAKQHLNLWQESLAHTDKEKR